MHVGGVSTFNLSTRFLGAITPTKFEADHRKNWGKTWLALPETQISLGKHPTSVVERVSARHGVPNDSHMVPIGQPAMELHLQFTASWFQHKSRYHGLISNDESRFEPCFKCCTLLKGNHMTSSSFNTVLTFPGINNALTEHTSWIVLMLIRKHHMINALQQQGNIQSWINLGRDVSVRATVFPAI